MSGQWYFCSYNSIKSVQERELLHHLWSTQGCRKQLWCQEDVSLFPASCSPQPLGSPPPPLLWCFLWDPPPLWNGSRHLLILAPGEKQQPWEDQQREWARGAWWGYACCSPFSHVPSTGFHFALPFLRCQVCALSWTGRPNAFQICVSHHRYQSFSSLSYR